jgi:excinuclease UvrABC ATPase subunit
MPETRTLREVEEDLWSAQIERDDWEGRIQELEDERIRVEDAEAETAECDECAGTGEVDVEWDTDVDGEPNYTCPVCHGTGERS